MKTALVVCFFVLVAVLPALARWQASYAAQPPEVQTWFKQQHNSRGEWCCDESDGHPYFDNYTMKEDGSVAVSLNGQPHVIAAELVLKGVNPTGHAVWWYRDTVSGHRDYCFAPGTLS